MTVIGLASNRSAHRGLASRRNSFPVALIAGAAVVAVLLGLVAITANPIIIAMVAMLLVAPILIIRPSWSIWVVLVGGMLVAGLLPIWAEGSASKAVWALSGLSFLLMLVVLVRALMTPGFTRDTPAFVWMALAFMSYAVIDGLLQWSTPYEVFSAIKRYFQAFGLLFALCWLPLLPGHLRRWRHFFVFVALVQLPWAAYERIRLVPIREGFQALYPGLVPIDIVAGTFGADMREGGANGAMAAFLIMMLAFLLARRREKLLSGSRLLVLSVLVLAPLFMGETKIVVVLLPLMFLVLYRREMLRRPHVALIGLCIGAVLTTAAGFAYVNVTKSRSMQDLVADTVSYNFQNKGHGGFLLNRTTALKFWIEKQSLADPVSAVVGNGLGSSHDATGGHMAVKYAGYGIGLNAIATLLWDLGALGLIMFVAILAFAWRSAGRLARSGSNAIVRADASAIQVSLPLFGVFLFYLKDLLQVFPFQIVFACLLGYLAWMHRQEARRVREP